MTYLRHWREECRRLTSTTALPFSPCKQTALLVFVLMRHVSISITSAESVKVRFMKEAVLSRQHQFFFLRRRGEKKDIPLLNLWRGGYEGTFCELSISFFLMLKMTWNRSFRSITRGSACVATNHRLIDTYWWNLNQVLHNGMASSCFLTCDQVSQF